MMDSFGKSASDRLANRLGSPAAPLMHRLGWFFHGAKWAAIFVVPLTALWLWQVRGIATEDIRQSWIVADLPVGAGQHFHYAEALAKAGRFDEAEKEFQIALNFDPNDAQLHYKFGVLLLGGNKIDAAVAQFQEAMRLNPQGDEVHYDHAYALQR